jgi:c-di-GMP-binding flagellar brake protein YcgR
MNQRRRTRVSAQKRTTLAWPGGKCEGELVNLSLKGCLVISPEASAAPLGEGVSVIIHLEPDVPDLDVHVQGQVVRRDATGVAVDFTEVELESFRHLFRLVQYNASDPESIEVELSRSAFSPPPGEIQ